MKERWTFYWWFAPFLVLFTIFFNGYSLIDSNYYNLSFSCDRKSNSCKYIFDRGWISDSGLKSSINKTFPIKSIKEVKIKEIWRDGRRRPGYYIYYLTLLIEGEEELEFFRGIEFTDKEELKPIKEKIDTFLLNPSSSELKIVDEQQESSMERFKRYCQQSSCFLIFWIIATVVFFWLKKKDLV